MSQFLIKLSYSIFHHLRYFTGSFCLGHEICPFFLFLSGMRFLLSCTLNQLLCLPVDISIKSVIFAQNRSSVHALFNENDRFGPLLKCY